MSAGRTVALLTALLVAATAARASGSTSGNDALPSSVPRPLHGVTTGGRTGLRLIVADNPPFLLDVDSDRITPIRGLPSVGDPVLAVSPVGDNTLVWIDHPRRDTTPRGQFYVIRHNSTRAVSLTSGWQAAPSRNGRALWLVRYTGAHHCALSELSLAGRTLRPAEPVACSTQLIDSGGGPILVNGNTATDPATGKAILRGSALWALSDGYALSSNTYHAPLTLTNLQTGSSRRLPWPSRIGGTDQAAVDPRTGLIALDFADPAYGGSGTQVTDMFLLDPRTGHFTHLPDMPAAVHLKATSMAWTNDGRLITLAETGSETTPRILVAIWRQGQERLHIRPVDVPTRTSGSDSFTIAST